MLVLSVTICEITTYELLKVLDSKLFPKYLIGIFDIDNEGHGR